MGAPRRGTDMLIHRLKVSGLLSFGPNGVDLPMEPLNVFIGPNGSGKSNFLEALALLQVAPRGITEPISRMGGVDNWLWKGSETLRSIGMETEVGYPYVGALRHSIKLSDRNGRPEVIDERIETSEAHTDERVALSYYRPPADEQAALEFAKANAEAALEDSRRKISPGEWSTPRLVSRYRTGAVDFAGEFHPEQSLLSVAATPDYPGLWYLKEHYERIRLFRNWSFGPYAELRKSQSSHDRADFLNESGTNLALVLSNFPGENKRQVVAALQKLYEGVVNVNFPVVGGTVALFLEESGNREIPATRLSDGTLRYLCLLAILLHPKPAPLVAIEEPELGLHPDLLPTVADLLTAASERCQLIVTTHSDVLVDALTDTPESVVVCEKHGGQTEMRRLDKVDLEKWLKDYTLGNLWSSGQLGGNRW